MNFQLADREIIPLVEIDGDVLSDHRDVTRDGPALRLTDGLRHVSASGESPRLEAVLVKLIPNGNGEV